MVYHQKALDLRIKINDEPGLGISYGNFGLIFSEKGEYDSAFHYINLALEKFTKFNYGGGIAMCYASLGSIWQKKGNQVKALEAFKKAEEYATAGNFLPDLVTISKALSEIHEALGQYRESTKYLNQYILFKDSLFNSQQSKEVQKMQIEFEYSQKQLQDSLASAEREKLAALETEKQRQLNAEQRSKFRFYIIGGIVVFILCALVVIVLSRINKKQKEYNAIIAEQKAVVEEKNKEITDSITYAKRIQEAILPPRLLVENYFPDSFILYKPKDIVAGDFYWLGQYKEIRFIAAADCTGHGVPGAMVSVVCSNALNRAVKEFNITETGQILDKVRELVIETFEKSERDVKDGMDIALIGLQNSENGVVTVYFSGANNPLWILKKDAAEITEVKGDVQPVGKHILSHPFKSHTIKVAKGDTLYCFTDGYPDQFGGEKGKKFKAANLRKLILSIRDKSMPEQQNILDQTFMAWKGKLEQLDDVCVIGVRI